MTAEQTAIAINEKEEKEFFDESETEKIDMAKEGTAVKQESSHDEVPVGVYLSRRKILGLIIFLLAAAVLIGSLTWYITKDSSDDDDDDDSSDSGDENSNLVRLNQNS